MADELLSCPFCGGEARPDAQTHMGRNYVGIICLGCGLWQDTRSPDVIGAIAAWNRRTPPTPATDTQEESMKLGGGTANGMRALGYQVLPPEPNSDSTCWRMIAPQDRNTEYLAADQAEGWRKAERHWHARNLENVVRLTPPTPATEEREAVARAERSGVLIALWAEYRAQSSEKLPVTIDDAHSRHRYLVSAFADAALTALTPHIAAIEAAAEANERARIEADLKDPQIVHMNMLRGGIAKINVTQAMHLNGWTSIDNWHRMTVEQIEAAVKARNEHGAGK